MVEPQQILEARVARLERQNRLLLASCLAAVAIPIALGAGQAGRQVPLPPGTQLGGIALPKNVGKLMTKEMANALKLNNEVIPALKTKMLCLVDSNGRARATLSTDEQNYPVLALIDSTGNTRGEWRLDNQGALYQALTIADKPVVRLGVVREPFGRAAQVRDIATLDLGGLSTRIMATNPERPQDGGVQLFSAGGRSVIELAGTNGYQATLGTYTRTVGASGASRYTAGLNLVSGPGGPTANFSADVQGAIADLRYRDTKLHATMGATSAGGIFTGRSPIGPPVNKHQKFESMLLESSARSAHIQTVAPDDD